MKSPTAHPTPPGADATGLADPRLMSPTSRTRRTLMQHRLTWLALPLLAVPLALADDKTKFTPGDYDWPQWQGVDRNAQSREKGLLQQWPKEGPKLLWTAEGLGENYCTPT